MKNKIVVGISGSSGSIYARVLLQKLATLENVAVSVIFSKNGLVNWELENTGVDPQSFGFHIADRNDFFEGSASGSSDYSAMIVCPCSAGFLAKAAHGLSDDLMSRTADVMLKERRKLILILRETPFSLIHIENMKQLTLAGAIICPAIPSFYSKPQSMDDLASTVTDRALHLAGINIQSFRWGQ
ncbi:MAG TPA: UbiX family flavin prenyltransferase [Saprospiraceae bacterium]|nr:UbiX family flavin prenyltransferase [Saprospiraceae bacterium]